MHRGMLILALLVTAALTPSARAQLKDGEFKPAAAGDFDGKGLFDVPKPIGGLITSGDKPTPLWSGSVEFGVFGNDGNSNVLKVRFGANAKRQVEDNVFTADLLYGLTTQRGNALEDKALVNLRDECFFKDSPWGVFAAGQLEYDEFRDFDFRVAAHAGVAYQVWQFDNSSLRARLGAGCQREIGGPKARYVPEGLVGADWHHQLTERQRFVIAGDYYPDLGTGGEYRVRVRAAWECLIDPSCNLILRLGVQDRYDSVSGTAKQNDLDYFTTLGMRF